MKSVHAALSVEWIAEQCRPQVLLIRRHPLDILASWVELGLATFLHDDDRLLPEQARETLEVPAPPVAPDPLPRAAWLIGTLLAAIDQAGRDLPGVELVDHEMLCRDPLGELRWTAQTCGLAWTEHAERFVARSQSPGVGEDLHRVASAMPGSWRERLAADQIGQAKRILAPFPFSARYEGLG